MKLYNITPQYLIRINIKKVGVATEFLTFCETTQIDCYNFIKELIDKQKISLFVKGKVTNIEMRECVGSKNGKSVSLSFKGLSPEEVKELILKNIK